MRISIRRLFLDDVIPLALEKVENLRIVSMSGLMKEIVVDYDRPLGCFDRVILICEMIASKQRKMIVNSTICTDLIPNEFYRIYVETKRSGWETVQSDSVEIQLILNNQIDSQTRKSLIFEIFLLKIRFGFFSQEELPFNRLLFRV